MGRNVFDAIFRPPRRDVTDMFLPRRTAFVYDMEGGETLDIPTTLHRSKADCPKVTKNHRFPPSRHPSSPVNVSNMHTGPVCCIPSALAAQYMTRFEEGPE